MRSVPACHTQLQQNSKIAIIGHVNPDADSYCSAIAFKKIILQHFSTEDSPKSVDIFFDTPAMNELYAPILKGVEINNEPLPEYDLAITVDCSDISRCGVYSEIVNNAKDSLNIDHHETNTYFAKNNLVLTRVSSTCETIFWLAKTFKLEMADDVLKLIYSGIITDTNNLELAVSKRTHECLAELSKKELNLEALREHFFKNNNKSKTFLLEKALASLSFICNERIAFMKITKQDLAQTGSTFEDTLGIVNHGISIKGVDVAIITIKQEDNSYYVSIRTKNNIDAASIAISLGGGGHENCAALKYTGSLVDLKEGIIKACKEQFKLHPQEEYVVDNLFYDSTDGTNNQ